MSIKCSECNGEMRKGIIVDNRISFHGYGMFQKKRHNGHTLKVGGKEYNISNLTHLEDEAIVVCSNFPKCHNHYIMKKYNFDERNVDKKIGKHDIKGYGTHHFRKGY